jgi:hypothetical protein
MIRETMMKSTGLLEPLTLYDTIEDKLTRHLPPAIGPQL